jgi:Protein of unknown function (DUF3558)
VRTVRTVRTASALLIGSLALAACSGGGGGDGGADEASSDTSGTGATSETSSTGAGNESPACRLLTTDEVSDLFGEPASVVPADQDVPVAGGSESCLWEASVDDGRSPTIYQLQLSVFTGSDAFDPRAWGDDPEAVDGLGDEAFLVRSGVLGTTAGYRAGDRSVFLSYAIPLGEDAPDSAAQADEVVDLLRTVDTRLG